jgi:hypothetical protein
MIFFQILLNENKSQKIIAKKFKDISLLPPMAI